MLVVTLLFAVLILKVSCVRDDLAGALASLIENVFSKETSVFSFYVMHGNETDRYRYFSDLTDYTLRELSNNISVQIGVQRQSPSESERDFSLLAVDSLAAFMLLRRELRLQGLNLGGYTVIVLQTFNENYYDVMRTIFEDTWRNEVVDVNIIVEPLFGLILMFTYFPFSIHNCNSVVPVNFNRYVDSKWKSADLFPKKLHNMYSCPLTFALWENEPNLKIGRDVNGRMTFTGVEGKMLEFMALRMNFSIYPYTLDDKQIDAVRNDKDWVFSKRNQTGVDLIAGSLRQKNLPEHYLYTPSAYYMFTAIEIVISLRRKRLSPLGKLVLPFSLQVWMLVILFFGSGVLVVFGSKWLSEHKRGFIIGPMNHTPVYNMLYTAIGGDVHRTPKRNFTRYILCLWILLWLVLRSGYQSALFHFIRNNMTAAPPHNINDVIKEGYQLFSSARVHEALNDLPSIQDASQILNGSEIEMLPMISKDLGKIAILTPFECFKYFEKQNRGHMSNFHVVKENIFVQKYCFYFRKNSFLNFYLDKAIRDFVYSGLALKWYRFYVGLESVPDGIEPQSSRQMTIEELFGAFEVFVAGSVLSLIVFAGEIIIKNFSNCCRQIFNKFR